MSSSSKASAAKTRTKGESTRVSQPRRIMTRMRCRDRESRGVKEKKINSDRREERDITQ
jgi:hypothetical protein